MKGIIGLEIFHTFLRNYTKNIPFSEFYNIIALYLKGFNEVKAFSPKEIFFLFQIPMLTINEEQEKQAVGLYFIFKTNVLILLNYSWNYSK